MRFLLVEDHLRMADQLARGFDERGHTVKVVHNGADGLHEALEIDYTLAVVDLGLPELSGLDLIKRLRTAGRTTPVIVLTARDDVQSVVEAMEAGADDYLKKPVYLEELFAHIDAVLRRVLGASAGRGHQRRFGPLALDTNQRCVRFSDELLELTRAEYDILEHLWLHQGKVQSKKSIADAYQREPGADTRANSVEGLVGRIKRKVDPKGDLKPIQTVRGQGYLFRDQP